MEAQTQDGVANALEAGYMRPPAVTRVQPGPGVVTLTGEAMPDAQVRLATPQGEAVTARANDKGIWIMPLVASDQVRVFGLSLTAGKRQTKTQAEGYLLVGPAGQVAMLRAGAGAIRLDHSKPLRLSAVDFDRAGAAMVSGEAPAGSPVVLRLDGSEVAQGRASAQGRFSISLPSPLQPGDHDMQIYSDGVSDAARVMVTYAEPPSAGPIRSEVTAAGLRVDWMTPGGGLQSTILTP